MTSPTPPSPPLEPPAPGWPPPPPPPPDGPPRTQLRRSSTDKVVGGVAGGLAEYTGIDPLLWRVGFIALTLAGGSGVLVYLLLWLLVPRDRGPVAAGDGLPAARSAPRSPLPGLTVAALLVVVGVLVLLTRYTAVDLGPRAFVGTALFVVGAGLAATAVTGGRGRAGLVVLGLVLSVALLAVTSAPVRHAADRGVGDHTFTPFTAAEVQPTYDAGLGNTTVDLSRIDLTGASTPVRTSVDGGVGNLTVLVPASADVEVDLSTGIGNVDVLDHGSAGGFFPGSGSAPWTGDGRPEFVISIDAGIGNVEVDRA